MPILSSLIHGWSSYDPQTEIPDLQGRVVIVTGANSGIGYQTARILASKGAKVYLGARNETRGKEAVESIHQDISRLPSSGSAHWLPLDLSTPQKAKAGADAFLAQESRLDILIHNAAMQVVGYSTVSEGGLTFNKIMSTNHLGPFVLTRELLPTLKRTAEQPGSDVRIVFVSSNGHYRVPYKPDLRNLEGWNSNTSNSVSESLARYGISKLANVLVARKLQSRLDAENVPITCISLHPGIVQTEAPLTILGIKPGVFATMTRAFLSLFALTTEQGAYTSLFAATSPKVKAEPSKYKGSYLQPYNRVYEASAYARDTQLGEDLWACSEEVSEICLRSSASGS